MEYRNPGAATHHMKGMVLGVESSNAGVEIQGSTIVSASDSAASGLTVKAKGTGTMTVGDSSNVVSIQGGASISLGADGTGVVNVGNSSNVVRINGSTTQFKLVAGQSTMTVPNMAGASQDVSTFAAAGLSTGDLIICVDARGTISTHVAMGGYTIAAADKVRVTWINCHASSIAPESTGVTVRWAFIDRS